MTGLNNLFATVGMAARAVGMPPCPMLQFDDPETYREFYRAACRHGVSTYSVSYLNYSHTAADIDEALERLDRAVADLT